MGGRKVKRTRIKMPKKVDKSSNNWYIYKRQLMCIGRLAQLVRAPALQAGGHRFESCIAHHEKPK